MTSATDTVASFVCTTRELLEAEALRARWKALQAQHLLLRLQEHAIRIGDEGARDRRIARLAEHCAQWQAFLDALDRFHERYGRAINM